MMSWLPINLLLNSKRVIKLLSKPQNFFYYYLFINIVILTKKKATPFERERERQISNYYKEKKIKK
jgi:hypothetical protein